MIHLNGKGMKSKIIQVLATEHGLSLKEVEKIVNSQFKCVADTMREKEFDSVRLLKFGVFRVIPGRVKYVTDAKRKSTGDRS